MIKVAIIFFFLSFDIKTREQNPPKRKEWRKKKKKADNLYSDKNTQEAKKLYLFLVSNGYKEKKIQPILTKISLEENIQKQYKELIDEGDKLFINKEYDLAKISYKKALYLLPDSTYPKTKLKEIDNIKGIPSNE